MGRAERRHKPKQDNSFIHQEKRWKHHVREMVPKRCAALALILKRDYSMSSQQIVEIIQKAQDLWQADGDNFDILATCVRETGINFTSKGDK